MPPRSDVARLQDKRKGAPNRGTCSFEITIELKSPAEETTASTTRAAGANLTNSLVVEIERDERRELSNLLGGQQRLGRWTEDRHLIEHPILGVANPSERLTEVVLVGPRCEIFRYRGPDRIDLLRIVLIQDRDAVRDVVAEVERIAGPASARPDCRSCRYASS